MRRKTDLTDQLTKIEPVCQRRLRWSASGKPREKTGSRSWPSSTDRIAFDRERSISGSSSAIRKSGERAPSSTMKLEGYARDQNEALSLNQQFLVKGDRYQGLPVTETPEAKQEYYSANVKKTIRIVPEKAPHRCFSRRLDRKGPRQPKREVNRGQRPGKPADRQTSDAQPRGSREGGSS